jgi:PAS domain-containing protein
MTKMYGQSLGWFSVVKVIVHEILVISFFETEIMMNKTMKVDPNYNIGLVVLDIALLLLVDVPYMPYPMNVFCVLTDGLFLSYRFLVEGVPWYICFKSMILVLLCAIYLIKDEKSKFKIQSMINEEIIQLNQFKECLNAMPEGVAIINQNLEVVFSNSALSKIIGQTEEEFNILKLKNADYFQKQSQKIRQKIEEEYLI